MFDDFSVLGPDANAFVCVAEHVLSDGWQTKDIESGVGGGQVTCICGGEMKRRGPADSAGGVLWRCQGRPELHVMVLGHGREIQKVKFRSCGRTRVTHPPLERTPRPITDLKERFFVREPTLADELAEERRWNRGPRPGKWAA